MALKERTSRDPEGELMDTIIIRFRIEMTEVERTKLVLDIIKFALDWLADKQDA